MRHYVLIASLLVLSACRSGSNEPPASVMPAAQPPQTQSEPAPPPARAEPARQAPIAEAELPPLVDPARQLPNLTGQLREDGYGLTTIPVDGSSPWGFQASLEIIAEETSQAQYQQLHSALEFLRVYTLGARDMQSFYATLDGATGEEIIQRAVDMRRR